MSWSTFLRPELFFAAVLLTAAAPSRGAEMIEIPYTKFVLDNGLTLIVHEDHKTPIVAVNVWYHVGSKNEKLGKTGFAHLFEHLMFNGSENFNDDWFQALERVGATDLNGTTSEDRTNYFQNVPKPALDLVLWMESDRMGHLLGAIDQAKLDEQRGVVQNEKRQGENQPYAISYDLITKATFPAGHPYSWTVIGEMEDLDEASLEDVQDWFKKYYGAANAVVTIAGDITPNEAKAKVERFFGDIPAGPPVARHHSWVAKRSGEQRQSIEDRVPQTRIYKVWNVPEWGSEQGSYLDLVTDVLGSGKNSRLYKRLVYEDQIATNASASVSLSEIAGQLMIVATVQPGGDVTKVEAALDEELARFIKDGPTESELERIKTQHRARFLRGIERIGGFGGKSDILARSEVFGGSPDAYKNDLAWVEAATGEDLRSAAEQWLSDGVYVLEVQPRAEYSEKPSDVDRSKLPEVSGSPKLDLPDVERAELSNGLKVVVAERHEIPTVEFALIIDSGYAADPLDSPGITSMAMSMLDEGTESRSSLEIEEELDRLGANLGSGAGLDSATVSLSALKENLDASLEVFSDIVLNPSFPEADFARLKRQRLATIQQEKARPMSIALRLLPGLIFGEDHAYGSPLTGSGDEASTEKMSREDLRMFHDTWFQPQNATLTIVGDTTLKEIAPMLESKLGGWKKTGDVPTKNIAHVDDPEKRVVYLVDKPHAQQSVIIAGIPALPKDNPDEIAIETMNAILGGAFTSRINMNLREDKHWAYGARSMVFDAKGQRLFLAYAPVQTDKTKESIQEMDKELRWIMDEKPATDEELTKAKNNQTLRLPGRFETKRALQGALREMVVYGRPADYYETYPDKVKALDLDQIQKAAAKVVKPDRLIWIVVGDLTEIAKGVDELGFGEVRRMSPDGELLN